AARLDAARRPGHRRLHAGPGQDRTPRRPLARAGGRRGRPRAGGAGGVAAGGAVDGRGGRRTRVRARHGLHDGDAPFRVPDARVGPGQFAQIVWSIAHGDGPWMTLPAMHAWGDHFSPILYLLVPLARLGPLA